MNCVRVGRCSTWMDDRTICRRGLSMATSLARCTIVVVLVLVGHDGKISCFCPATAHFLGYSGRIYFRFCHFI
ncbi:hypothetical protein B0H11DRAFT_2280589 [Mycena galericulata]|nr:hypothetical protein B0H11DRAFT_2280589 [Mycena galericulata]